ncbi:MAG: poly-gamma-glutamate biosynthesis protein PgsC/CapC [Oleiphilaceae bacterium]|nr:poly-gamma-glutamate biosynthesis protein PgsC/CapC [Oleiphilaceae bacterium]
MLEIFPANSLDSSIITTVWVGLTVVALLNLRFGMTLSGLVIPGYLVPLLILRPASALITVAEGLITYLLALLLARGVFTRFGMGEMFGRDRFFAIVLISVVVRVVSDGLALPVLGEWLTGIGWNFDYRNNFHSFGLVIISLIANQMWNGGARRGLMALMLYTGLTYLIVRFVLMAFTNFSISNLGFMYEHMATSILASPQSYIILLTAAFIASRMNLRYGWEFNGILLPALLALQWYQPFKLVATLAEAFLILFICRGLLRLPWFNQRNMEGARLLLLFFNVGFIYKLLFSYFMNWQMPMVKVSDYYAFGYLLSTLLAIKMFQKDISTRLTRATLQASLTAVVAASVIGFALSYVVLSPGPSDVPLALATTARAPAEPVTTAKARPGSLAQQILDYKTRLYRYEQGGNEPLDFTHLRHFEQGLQALRSYSDSGQERDLGQAESQLALSRFSLVRLNTGVFLLRDQLPQRAGGLYLVNVKANSPLVIEVPAPLDERGTMEAAAWYFESQKATGLAIAGSRRAGRVGGIGDVLENRHTFFHVFHEVLGQGQALQLRGTRPARGREANTLWIKRDFPQGLSPGDLTALIAPLEITWGAPPFPNQQRDSQYQGFAELFLPLPALRALVNSSAFTRPGATPSALPELPGPLLTFLEEIRQTSAQLGSEGYVPAPGNELLFINDEVLVPLLELLEQEKRWPPSPFALQELREINALAAVVGYQLMHHYATRSNAHFLVLRENPDNPERRHWGTYVFRIGPTQGFSLQLPRAVTETQTLPLAVNLLEQHQARALLMAGSHHLANADGSADVLSRFNRDSLFSLVHQALIRWPQGPVLALQLRSAGSPVDMPDDSDVLLAFREASPRPVVAPAIQHLKGALAEKGLRLAAAGRALAIDEYDVPDNAQSRFLETTTDKDLAVLWMTPGTRAVFDSQPQAPGELAKYAALEIPSSQTDILQWAAQQQLSSRPGARQQGQALAQALATFIRSRDIMLLAELQARHPDWRWQHLIDHGSGQAFMAISDDKGLLILADLFPLTDRVTHIAPGNGLTAVQMATFVNRRHAVLIPGEAP